MTAQICGFKPAAGGKTNSAALNGKETVMFHILQVVNLINSFFKGF